MIYANQPATMFTEWTDPHDIDHYYDDVGKIFSKVAAYVDPTKQAALAPIVDPVVPVSSGTIVAAPTVPVASAPVPVGIVQNPAPAGTTDTPIKSGFEVVPNSIFIDGHSVGSQPAYNILRSGPPVKDTYINRYSDQMAQVWPTQMASNNSQSFFQSEMLTIILWFIIGLLIVQIINLNMTVSANRATLQLLYQLMNKKM
jgi:hypothetical protein